MRKKILYLVPEIEFTEIQKEWLLHPHEDNRPLFKQYFNDYSYVTINPDLHLWEFKIVKAAVDWLCYHYADKSFSETQLQTLVELILNRELQPNEKPHITDAWALWCINYEDFEDTQNIVSNIVRQYAVCSDAEPVYSCLVPAQLALFLMTACPSVNGKLFTPREINSFWDSLRTEMTDMIILANTIQKHVDLK